MHFCYSGCINSSVFLEMNLIALITILAFSMTIIKKPFLSSKILKSGVSASVTNGVSEVIDKEGDPPVVGNRVLLTIGASNSTGFLTGGGFISPDTPLANLIQVPMSSGSPSAPISLVEPMDYIVSSSSTTRTPAAQQARLLAQENAGADYYVLPAATFSVDLDTDTGFHPPNGPQYQQLESGIAYINSNIDSPIYDAALWSGSAWLLDPGYTVPTMINNYNDLISAVRDDTATQDLPFVSYPPPAIFAYGWMQGGDSGQETIDMTLAYRQNPLDSDNTFHIPSPLRAVYDDDFLLAGWEPAIEPGSDYHYSPDSLRAFGEVSKVITPLISALTSSSPNPVSLSDPGSGYVSFLVPSTSAHKYVMRYRDSGTLDPWTEVDRWPYWGAVMPGDRFIANVPTLSTLSQEVQVKAVSRGGDSAWSNTLTIAGVERTYGWRVHVTANNGDEFVNCFELGMKTFSGGPDIVLEGQYFEGSSFSGLPASFSFNGRRDNGWASESEWIANNSGWFGVFFDEPRIVNQILWASRNDGSIRGPDQAPMDFTFEKTAQTDTLADVNNDVATWTATKTITNQTGWDINGETRVF